MSVNIFNPHTRTFYRSIDAALRWCNLIHYEAQIVQAAWSCPEKPAILFPQQPLLGQFSVSGNTARASITAQKRIRRNPERLAKRAPEMGKVGKPEVQRRLGQAAHLTGLDHFTAGIQAFFPDLCHGGFWYLAKARVTVRVDTL